MTPSRNLIMRREKMWIGQKLNKTLIACAQTSINLVRIYIAKQQWMKHLMDAVPCNVCDVDKIIAGFAIKFSQTTHLATHMSDNAHAILIEDPLSWAIHKFKKNWRKNEFIAFERFWTPWNKRTMWMSAASNCCPAPGNYSMFLGSHKPTYPRRRFQNSIEKLEDIWNPSQPCIMSLMIHCNQIICPSESELQSSTYIFCFHFTPFWNGRMTKLWWMNLGSFT